MTLRTPKTPLLTNARDGVGWAVFIMVLVATCFIWVHISGVIEDNARKRFDEIAELQRDLLIDRMKDYEQVLLGGAGLFAASDRVSRQDWRDYVDALRLHLTLPGIEGIGYTVMVPAMDKAAHEARIRAEGFPSYAIAPAGDREIYSSIIYLEPFSGRNLRAFGYDMYSEPTRQRAMKRAAETGDPAWTDKVTLVQEGSTAKPQPGFLVYVPIYARNKPIKTIEERYQALTGFVYSPFRAGDMLSQLYEDPQRLFNLKLYSGAPVPENLLYETSSDVGQAKFQKDLPIVIGGTQWHANFFSNANFNYQEFSQLPLISFFAALSMECLLFITFLINEQRRRNIESSRQELEKNNHEMYLMTSLTQLLQNCIKEDEVGPILSEVMRDLFPNAYGAYYLLNPSTNFLAKAADWGNADMGLTESFALDDCWAYRRGQKHGVGYSDNPDVPCRHVDTAIENYVCIPLQAQGKLFGTLYLAQPLDKPLPENVFGHYVEILSSVADTVSLSLSNLRLRSSLLDLSLRDPLTGLYNRRYMEEGLQRELDRARRLKHEIAVVVLDVDHFKSVNDTYGHDAGDLLLKRLSEQMKVFRSGNDIICRFGGEEFVLVLTDIALPILKDRLEKLRAAIEAMRIDFDGTTLPVSTVSMGVARFPTQSQDGYELLKLADNALYRAKQNGRNRVEFA